MAYGVLYSMGMDSSQLGKGVTVGASNESNESSERDTFAIIDTEHGPVRFVRSGPPVVAIPQRYVMIENTPGYLSEDDEPFVSDDFDAVVAYMDERVDEYMDHIEEGGGEPAVVRGSRWAYVTDTTREHDLGRNFSVNEYEGGDDE